ncbi:MAG: undecaprenyldiphospho-muramoylpentapeptide beta-N-acetylglucosaminyltransferase [Bacteroidota bacterium]
MKIIISGGGSGGHIYPAVAIANALQDHDPSNELLFVGAQGKMEMQQVPAAGYPIVGLSIRGIQRKQVFRNLSVPFRMLHSLWKAKRLLKHFQPDVVVGTGGYASAPILYAATQLQIPTLVQEQNAYAGLTNRLLAKRLDKVCVAYKHMDRYFPADKIVLTGNPVRQDITNLAEKRLAAYEYFGLVPDRPCLLVLGGSLGAHTINESVLQALDQLLEAGIQVIWPTGSLYFEDIQAQLTEQQRAFVKLYPFIELMNLAYAAADVVVSRAGALAIAELCIVGKPTIFIPSPNVVADHQTKNLQPLVAQDAALLIHDKEARQKLSQTVIQLFQDADRQSALVQSMRHWAKQQATADIVTLIYALANGS